MSECLRCGRAIIGTAYEGCHANLLICEVTNTGDSDPAASWPRPGDDDHISAFDGTLADGLDWYEEGAANGAASRYDDPDSWVSGGHEKFETPVLPVRDDEHPDEPRNSSGLGQNAAAE